MHFVQIHLQSVFRDPKNANRADIWKYQLNSSKKVWKSEFDRLFPHSLSNNRCMFDTIRKTI